jgi:hypothetical protein
MRQHGPDRVEHGDHPSLETQRCTSRLLYSPIVNVGLQTRHRQFEQASMESVVRVSVVAIDAHCMRGFGDAPMQCSTESII